MQDERPTDSVTDESRESEPAQTGWLSRLKSDERGVAFVEYTLLLIGMYISCRLTLAPLEEALLGFARDVFVHLSLP